MIGVLTHHWVKSERLVEARSLLEGNGKAQSRTEGFVRRINLYSLSDSNKITSLAIWHNEEIYEQWRASPQRRIAMAGAEALWAKPPESERFDVMD